MALATSCGAVATPSAPVVAVAVEDPPAKAALAPLPGALKVTVTPATGCEEASSTLAASFVAKAVPTVAD